MGAHMPELDVTFSFWQITSMLVVYLAIACKWLLHGVNVEKVFEIFREVLVEGRFLFRLWNLNSIIDVLRWHDIGAWQLPRESLILLLFAYCPENSLTPRVLLVFSLFGELPIHLAVSDAARLDGLIPPLQLLRLLAAFSIRQAPHRSVVRGKGVTFGRNVRQLLTFLGAIPKFFDLRPQLRSRSLRLARRR